MACKVCMQVKIITVIEDISTIPAVLLAAVVPPLFPVLCLAPPVAPLGEDVERGDPAPTLVALAAGPGIMCVI